MHLFVYGTLRRSAASAAHHLLAASVYLGQGRFQGKLYDLGRYPAAVASTDSADQVYGEVYLLHAPPAILAALDRYEGCAANDPPPHEYVRTTVAIHVDAEATILSAQIYLYNLPTTQLTRIEPGDYLAWRARGLPSSAGA